MPTPDEIRRNLKKAADENANIVTGSSEPARTGESVSVNSNGRSPVRARAFRAIPGSGPVVAFRDPNGGWAAAPEHVIGRDDVQSRTRQGAIARTYGDDPRRVRETVFLIGVPRYVKAARVLVAFSFPVEKEEPVELACPSWIKAVQNDEFVCIPVPYQATPGHYDDFPSCRANEPYTCPAGPPQSPGGGGGGGGGSAPVVPPPRNRVSTFWIYGSFPSFGRRGAHGDQIFLVKRPSGLINAVIRTIGDYRVSGPGRPVYRRGQVLMDWGGGVVAVGSRISAYLNESDILDDTARYFHPRNNWLSFSGGQLPSCGQSFNHGFPQAVYTIEENISYDESGDRVGQSYTLIGKENRTATRIADENGWWYREEDFPGCPDPGGGDGDDDSDNGGGSPGGGTAPPEPPQPPQCFRTEGQADNVARQFYVGAEEEPREPTSLIEISDVDEYALYLEAAPTGWSTKMKYGMRENKYCKQQSFGTATSGWQDPIADNLEVYSAGDIASLEADPCVKENAGLDVNIVREGGKIFRYSVDRAQLISATHSLGNAETTLEDELKRIVPTDGSDTKDPIPVDVIKEEIDVTQTQSSDACSTIAATRETLPGAVYRIAYSSILPADAVVSQNGCPVGEFEIEQLSALIVPEV